MIPPDGGRGRSLLDAATAIVRIRNPKGRAALVHRVDRDTSGCVMFAKSARGKREIMGDWNELVTERRYLALVEGAPPAASGGVDDFLVENAAGTVYSAPAKTRGALRAITRWELVEKGARYSLVAAVLETGRRHQARVHLAGLGCPVAGDERYGARSDPLGRVCLHAAVLEFRHPFTGETVRVESPIPPEFLKALKAAPRRDADAEASAGRKRGPGGEGRGGALPVAPGRSPEKRTGERGREHPARGNAAREKPDKPRASRGSAPDWARPAHERKRGPKRG